LSELPLPFSVVRDTEKGTPRHHRQDFVIARRQEMAEEAPTMRRMMPAVPHNPRARGKNCVAGFFE